MPLHQINLAKYLKPENYKLLLKKNLKNETELLYFEMQLIRCFENKLLNLFEKNLLFGTTHTSIGQECNSVSFLNAIKPSEDIIWSNHRCHGHFISYSGNIIGLMAEIMGKKLGVCGGRGGSQHLHYKNFYSNGILGGSVPQAVGSAFALKNKKSICISFIGDGTLGEGVFYESLQFASLRNLPVIFVCENNLYSSHLRIEDRRSEDNIYKSAETHGMEGVVVDGNNTLSVYLAAMNAVNRARSGLGPTLIECKTYRWRGHVGPSWDLNVNIRDKEELDAWMQRDPIEILSKEMIEASEITKQDLNSLKKMVSVEIDKSVQFARQSSFPDVKELSNNVYSKS